MVIGGSMELSERLYHVLKSIRGVAELNGGLKLPGDTEVEIYLETGPVLTPVVRVTEVKVDSGLWTIRNAKSETLYFPSERVVGLRVSDPGKGKRGESLDRGAGFTRGL